jgi:S1-C subfamily serine protease
VAEGDEALTVMKGVLSGRTRLSAARGVQPFPYLGDILLLDAITSGPGQGGSAVVDLEGRLIGVVGKSVTSRQTNTLLNYALPVEEIAAFLKDADAGTNAATRPAPRTVGPGYHGISLSKIAYHRQLPFVRSVAKDSPAAKAGVRADDLIVSANGIAIPRGRDFTELCDRLSPGQELSLIVKRGEQLTALRLTLEEPPK